MVDTAGTQETITRTVRAGELTGVAEGGIMRFLGVPYAAPPFGPHRFALPQPPSPWTGARDARRPGPSAPQNPALLFADALPPVNADEGDVLHVNVWAPVDRARPGHPVLVWFHGGALIEGSNGFRLFDGSRFAAQGTVVVVANYRLGAEGFSVLDGAPTNLGLADQAAVLRWVQDEVAVFGGDPGRVTVAGQSAGGNTVAALVSAPATQGLLQRAVVQSGPLEARPVEEAGEITRRMAHELGVAATREAFARIAPATLLAAQAKVLGSAVPVVDDLGFHLAVDGDLVVEPPAQALARGAADAVPLLTGMTSEEHLLWMGPTGVVDLINDETLALVAARKGLPPAVVDAYRRSRPAASPGELLGLLLSDHMLRAPMVAVADARAARHAPTHVYEFSWRSPERHLGAGHSVELPFVFDSLASPDGRLLVGDDAPTALARDMNRAWGRFVRGEPPGWPAWDASRPVRVWDGATNPVVHDLHPEEREAMAAVVAVVAAAEAPPTPAP